MLDDEQPLASIPGVGDVGGLVETAHQPGQSNLRPVNFLSQSCIGQQHEIAKQKESRSHLSSPVPAGAAAGVSISGECRWYILCQVAIGFFFVPVTPWDCSLSDGPCAALNAVSQPYCLPVGTEPRGSALTCPGARHKMPPAHSLCFPDEPASAAVG